MIDTQKPSPAEPLIPKETPGPNSLILDYENYNIQIVNSRLRETSAGKVEGEISVKRPLENGKSAVLLVPQSFGFCSSTARKDLIKSMADRVNGLAWLDIVEDVCDRVLTHVRAGEPEHLIDSSKIIIKQPEYLLYPFLPRNQPSIIVGKKGSAKTTLVENMAICVASGWYNNLWFKGVSKYKHNVLWLDWETDQEGFEYDIKRLCDAAGVCIVDNIIYQHCVGALSEQIERIKLKKLKHNCVLTIVDSIAPASGGDIKEAKSAIALYQSLRYLGDTYLLIGHPTKAADDTGQRSSSVTGAGQFEDLARNIWEATWDQEEDENFGHQALWHRKNFKTGYLKPIGFQIVFCDDSIIITSENPRDIPKFMEKMSDPVKILEYLKIGAKTHKDISEMLGKKGNSVSVRLNELEKSGKIIHLPTGKWGLVAYPV